MFALPVMAQSAPKEVLSLAEILKATVRSKPSLELASIDSKRAVENARAADGLNDWQLDATGRIFRQRATNVSGNVTGTNKSDVVSLQSSISRQIPTGGRVSLGFNLGRNQSEFAFSGNEVTTVTSDLSATLDQPLLRGRLENANNTNKQQADLQISIAEANLEQEARQTLFQVIRDYWELAYAEKELQIRKASLKLATLRLANTRQSVLGGAIPKSSITEVEQVIAQRNEAIALADLAIVERSIALRLSSGLEIGPSFTVLSAKDQLTSTTRTFNETSILNLAEKFSPELITLSKQKEGSKLDVQVTKAGMLPRLDLQVFAGPQGIDDNIGGSLSQTIQAKGYAAGGTLTFSMPLENTTAKYNKNSAELGLKRALISEKQIKLQLASSVIQAVARVRASRKQVDFSKRFIELAKKNIENEKSRFNLGRATNFDVLERQTELQEAELRRARSLADQAINIAFVDSLSGAIFKTNNILLERQKPGR